MGLEDVKKGLEKQLKQERAAIDKETAEQKEALLTQATSDINAYKESVETKTQEDIAVLERRELSSAKLQAKKLVLEAKKELIDHAFSDALKQLENQSDKERKALLEQLIKKASKEIDVHTVYVAKQDEKLLTGYTTKTVDIAGGVICESKDGTQRIDLSIAAILATVRDKHLKEVAETLF